MIHEFDTGTYFTIVDRKCSEKVQPNVKLGDIYIVDRVEQTKTGIPVLVAHDKDDSKRSVRCNAERFRWVAVDFYNAGEQPYTGKLKEGHIITITSKLVERHIQSQVQVNELYAVDKVKRFTDGHTEITVHTLNRSRLTYKLSSNRYRWERLVVGNMMKSEADRKKEQKAIDKMYAIASQHQFEQSKDKLLKDFTFAEQAKITYVPMIVYILAWDYAASATEYAAAHRIDEVKKLSRTVKMLREKYVDYLKKDISVEHLRQITHQAQLFKDEHQLLFTQWYYTVLNAINHQHTGVIHDELSAYAFIAKMLLSFLYEFENEMTALIRHRLGSANDVHLPHQEALSSCMDAYIGNQTIGMTNEIETALRVFANEINKIEYVIRP